jgi:hypothetical protein
MIETIQYDNTVVAIILYKDYHNEGIRFISPNEFALQMGYMSRPAGYVVEPHIHNPVRREVYGTQEVLFIKDGVIEIDFYSHDQAYLESRTLSAGDMILLVGAGHGITVLEPATIIEIKNGPYMEEADKGRFKGNKRQK